MRTIFLPGALLLVAVSFAACGRQAPDPAPAWRDTSRLIGSAALFDPARFVGDWQVIASYPVPGCAPERLTYDGARMALACADGAVIATDAPVTGPGRFATAFGDALPVPELWVIWADFDYRTVVLGTPDGTVGMILDRQSAIAPDRMVAAREMLDFNGYDLAGLTAAAP